MSITIMICQKYHNRKHNIAMTNELSIGKNMATNGLQNSRSVSFNALISVLSRSINNAI